jgi:hypothetical protein
MQILERQHHRSPDAQLLERIRHLAQHPLLTGASRPFSAVR